MNLSIEHDRTAQLLVGRDTTLDFEAAQARLERAALVVSWDVARAQESWLQAALFALVQCARKMFRGGVYLAPALDAPCRILLKPAWSLRAQLLRAGAKEGLVPAGALHLHVGFEAPLAARLVCAADGWTGVVSPKPSGTSTRGNEISGVLAAAMGVAEAFRILLLRDLRAGRREKRLSAWGPNPPNSAEITSLPTSIWMLGLGNLGQALLFTLGLLPYADPGALTILMQDNDVVGPENLPVQLLTDFSWVGLRKARECAAWAEHAGFNAATVETKFSAVTRAGPGEPRILLGGVDNLAARRFAAEAGFDLMIDAGLGAGSVDAFDFRLHAFPGERTSLEAWPEISEASVEPDLNPALQKLVDQGRLDRCGAVTLAGKSVGVPCAALAATAIQLGQLCRALADGVCCDRVDGSLTEAAEATYHVMDKPIGADLAFTRAAT